MKEEKIKEFVEDNKATGRQNNALISCLYLILKELKKLNKPKPEPKPEPKPVPKPKPKQKKKTYRF